MNTPEMETERLILRKFTKEDAEALFLILSDKEVNTFLPWFPLKTLAEAEQYLQEKYLNSCAQENGHRYAVCLKTDRVPIGYVHVSDHDSHDLGYGLRKEFWHKGITTEACGAVVERLREAGFPFFTATHDIRNPRSGAVMKKIGMTYRYSYQEHWQPKDLLVTFRMYQIHLNGCEDETYRKYWEESSTHFVEENV